MLGVQEPGHVEVGADVLDDHVWRLAPAADGHVAVGQGEAFERGRVRGPDHGGARSGRVRQSGDVDRVDAREVGADPVGTLLLPGDRTVPELRAQLGVSALVEPERCRRLRHQPQQVLADRVEQLRRLGFPALAAVPAAAAAAAGVEGVSRWRERADNKGMRAAPESVERASRRFIGGGSRMTPYERGG
jgi:hypothetical protein